MDKPLVMKSILDWLNNWLTTALSVDLFAPCIHPAFHFIHIKYTWQHQAIFSNIEGKDLYVGNCSAHWTSKLQSPTCLLILHSCTMFSQIAFDKEQVDKTRCLSSSAWLHNSQSGLIFLCLLICLDLVEYNLSRMASNTTKPCAGECTQIVWTNPTLLLQLNNSHVDWASKL
jgi:hypothetical protein